MNLQETGLIELLQKDLGVQLARPRSPSLPCSQEPVAVTPMIRWAAKDIEVEFSVDVD